eukprot:gene21340-28275_t
MRSRLAISALKALQRSGTSGAVSGTRTGSFALFRTDAEFEFNRSELQFASAHQTRGITNSVGSYAEPITSVPVEGDVAGVLKQISDIVTSETATGKEVADAAVSLAYLQVKGARRVWGQVFEAALASKDTFDAASLSAFMWAATTAGVDHFKTVFELSGAVSTLLKSFTPTQLSLVVEALGKSHVKDRELFGKVADMVTADLAKFKAGELSRILWAFGATCQDDPKLVKAVSKALADKASELSPREAVQAVWGLAKLRKSDKATLDPLIKAASSKMGSAESGVDAAALAWSIGYLGPTRAWMASASDLTTSHAIDAAWGLAVGGSADQAAISALFASIGAAVDKAPESVDVYQLGALYNAAAMVPGVKLPSKVMDFSKKMYALGAEAIKVKRTSAVQSFRADMAEAAAYASGARYRPEVTAAVAGFAKTTDGIAVDISMELDANTKIAIEAVGPMCLSASGSLLGPAIARAKLLETKGYKVVSVPISEWSGLGDSKAKAAYLLKAIKAAAPGASSKVSALETKLNQPFDAYAE